MVVVTALPTPIRGEDGMASFSLPREPRSNTYFPRMGWATVSQPGSVFLGSSIQSLLKREATSNGPDWWRMRLTYLESNDEFYIHAQRHDISLLLLNSGQRKICHGNLQLAARNSASYESSSRLPLLVGLRRQWWRRFNYASSATSTTHDSTQAGMHG